MRAPIRREKQKTLARRRERHRLKLETCGSHFAIHTKETERIAMQRAHEPLATRNRRIRSSLCGIERAPAGCIDRVRARVLCSQNTRGRPFQRPPVDEKLVLQLFFFLFRREARPRPRLALRRRRLSAHGAPRRAILARRQLFIDGQPGQPSRHRRPVLSATSARVRSSRRPATATRRLAVRLPRRLVAVRRRRRARRRRALGHSSAVRHD